MKSPDLAIPILPSRSLPDTLAFYGRLGFAGEIIGGAYGIVSRGDLEVHFFLHAGLNPAARTLLLQGKATLRRARFWLRSRAWTARHRPSCS